jgi:hypothetical protein
MLESVFVWFDGDYAIEVSWWGVGKEMRKELLGHGGR